MIITQLLGLWMLLTEGGMWKSQATPTLLLPPTWGLNIQHYKFITWTKTFSSGALTNSSASMKHCDLISVRHICNSEALRNYTPTRSMANKIIQICFSPSFPGVETQSKTFEKSVGSRSRTPSIKAATAASASLNSFILLTMKRQLFN